MKNKSNKYLWIFKKIAWVSLLFWLIKKIINKCLRLWKGHYKPNYYPYKIKELMQKAVDCEPAELITNENSPKLIQDYPDKLYLATKFIPIHKGKINFSQQFYDPEDEESLH